MIADQGADPAPFGTGNEDIANMQCPACDQNRCDGTATPFKAGFDDGALCGTVRIGFQFHQFGLENNSFLQRFDIGAFRR